MEVLRKNHVMQRFIKSLNVGSFTRNFFPRKYVDIQF